MSTRYSPPPDDMNKRKPNIIEDKKQRGEWAESVFLARAHEHGLPVSRPWGDTNSYDFVVGRPGRFVAVQVKCTVARSENGKGYVCSVCSSHKRYRRGSFDFLVAYVVFEDAWYIIPEEKVHGKLSISLLTQCSESRYEGYREAWHLLREAIAAKEETNENASDAEEPAEPERMPRNALERMEASFRFMKSRLEVDP
jgi:hypothetical protein